jgi:hypothetical protein
VRNELCFVVSNCDMGKTDGYLSSQYYVYKYIILKDSALSALNV